MMRLKPTNLELVFVINNVDCDMGWPISFCLSICMDNLLGLNQTKYVISHLILIITIIGIKKLEHELLHS